MDLQPQSDQPPPAAEPQPTPAIASPIVPAVPLEADEKAPVLGWLDWIVRLALWGGIVFAFARQLGGDLGNNEVLLTIMIFAVLMAGYLLASVTPVARLLRQAAVNQPLALALFPLALLAPFVYYSQWNHSLEAIDLLSAAALLFLPTALAIINTTALRGSDVLLGLVAVAMPLTLPLTRNTAIDATDAVLRLGAFALPVLLLIITTREQRKRMNFLLLCAVLALWYSVEFNAFPAFVLPGQIESLSYFNLALIPLFLFILAVAGRFGGLGLSFAPTPRGVSIVTSNMVVLALIVVPLGLVTQFITPGAPAFDLLDWLSTAVTIFLFVALPEEILFRGALLSHLQDTYRWSDPVTIGVSALIFGASHLNNPPNVGWYFVLATVAGVFYARTYLMTKNVGASAVLHTIVNWLWATIFRG